jgi:hypothetical protein
VSRLGAAALALALSPPLGACISAAAPELPPQGAPAMAPEDFFVGNTISTGLLRMLGGGEKKLAVDGRGFRETDGSFSLQQTIRWADGDVDRRTWRMRPLGGGRYEATVEGVKGRAEGWVAGRTFHLKYTLDTGPGVRMRHWMTLEPEGRTMRNIAVGRVFGVPVARLDETFARPVPADDLR